MNRWTDTSRDLPALLKSGGRWGEAGSSTAAAKEHSWKVSPRQMSYDDLIRCRADLKHLRRQADDGLYIGLLQEEIAKFDREIERRQRTGTDDGGR